MSDEQVFTQRYFYSIEQKGWYLQSDMDAYANVPTDLVEVSESKYLEWCYPPDGYYQIFDSEGPRIEKIPPPDYPSINAAEAQRRIDAAMNSISVLVTKLNMGRTLTTAEKAKVNAVLDYCDAIAALDLSGETVAWPELPNI